jgi:hypothetical protein
MELLYSRHGVRIYGVCLRITGNVNVPRTSPVKSFSDLGGVSQLWDRPTNVWNRYLKKRELARWRVFIFETIAVLAEVRDRHLDPFD